MSGRSWVSYAAAVVVGVVVGYFAGPQAGYMAGMATLGVTSAILNKQKPQGFTNAAEDLDIASATEAVPVPVIFGNVRMGGNFIRWDVDSFRAVEVKANSGGGKGGGGSSEQTVGYNYYLSYLYGLCMGSLDGIGRIWDGAEMKVVSEGFTAFSGDYLPRVISGADMSGTINVYRGTATQPAAEIGGIAKADTHLRYKHHAYAWMEDFLIGQRPTPKTLLFELVRWPVCVDDNGDAIPGMIATGSHDDTGTTWLDANPAAIIFELFTNKIWGRGMSVDFIDVASFVKASQFFADNDLGISLAVDTQSKLSDIVEFVQRHVSTATIWDGSKLKLVVLMNPADDETPVDITREQVAGPVLTRPAWPDCANELRAEFINKEDDWKKAVACVQDDAAIDSIGGQINSQLVTVNGFTHRSVAEAQTLRILNEMSYPQSKLNFKMNRWAGITPGRRFRFVWDEIGALPINLFFRVMEISDRMQDADGIEVTAVEDLYAQAYYGAKQDFAAVPPAFQDNSFASNDDLSLAGNANDPYDPGTMEPRAFELNIFTASGARQFAVLTEQGGNATIYASHSWRTGSNPFTSFASTKGWAITGKLLTAIPVTDSPIQRSTWGATFDFDLTEPGNATALLSSANKVLLDTDHMANLTAGPYCLMFIDKEVFLIGKVVLVSAGVYRASNFLRAFMGTEQAAHAINADFAYVDTWDATTYVVGQGDIPDTTNVDFQTNVATPQSGLLETEFAWTGPESGQFIGLGVRPFVPGFLNRTHTVDNWVVNLRPRIHGGGAQYLPRLADDMGNLTNKLPDGYGLYVQPYISGSPAGSRVAVTANFIPDDGATVTTGVWNFTYNAPAGTTALRVWSSYRGQPSLAYVDIAG